MADVISLPHHPQSAEGFCLAACARMVLAYWGKAVSEKDVVELLRIGISGVPASAIRRLSQWGWDVDYGRGIWVDLKQWLQKGIPVIAFVRTDFLEYWTTDVGHAVVAVSMPDEQVHVHDPAMEEAPVSVSAIGFEAAWTEMDYGYAVITPASGER
ncbi:MAG: cysteine peptidase family C39 domain-containing protein [Anaerolineae bacterium]|nr:cysteine peptidase family C39 domain-containing protein [Anaerolineae bacterium]